MRPPDRKHATFRAKVDPAGRVLIPAIARQRLGIGYGDDVLVEVEEHGLRITTAQQTLKEVQAYFAAIKKPGESVVDELIHDRRDEAARE